MSRRGLGRGLGALIPTTPPAGEPVVGQLNGHPLPQADIADIENTADTADTADVGAGAAPHTDSGANATAVAPTQVGAYFAEIPLDRITPNPRQPRQVFDEDELHELVRSIEQIGLLQPIVVRPLAADGAEARFELVVGERRWRAAQRAGTGTIPAIVRETDDDDLLRNALLENLHRSQLNPLEEAAAYDQLLQDFGCTHDELAGRLGRSRPQISNTLRLLKLPTPVQRRVAAGVLSAGHARALLGLDDADAQDRLAQRIVAEGLSVRAVEEIVAVGEAVERGARTRTSRPADPGLLDLAGRLSDRLETRVRVELGRSKGKLTIEFGSLDDLHRIVGLIDPA